MLAPEKRKSELLRQLLSDSATMKSKIWDRVKKCPDTGCWLWTGFINPGGYAAMSIWDSRDQKSYSFRVHQATYAHKNGLPPPGLVTDHLCRVRHCVNPEHLQMVTNRENVLRGDGYTAKRARQTHCKNGHPLKGDNLYINPSSGGRVCRTCVAKLNKKYEKTRVRTYK